MKKIWIFRFISVLIPVLFFVFLELALRLAGYGRSMPLFIENPAAPEYLLPRPDIVKRYFPEDSQPPTVSIEVNFFKKHKPKDGLRVFVQGGSTAAGFPYGLGASLAGMLDYRLKQSFPERPVEVVSTALSAVNSYTLLDFSDEIIEHQPDAIVIYAGHNEYLGLLGVGSSYAFIDSRYITLLFLELRELRLFQLLQSILWRTAEDDGDNKASQNSRTFMAKVAKNKNIPLDSTIYQRGQAQFKGNMEALLQKYRRAGIPVFVATIGSNIADQAPFVSTEVSAADQQKFNTALAGLNLAVRDDRAQQQLSETVAFAEKNKSAQMYFAIAQQLNEAQRYAEAKKYFTLARDHDLLRFRAPSDTNQVVRELAQMPGVYLVEAEAALEKAASTGLIGHNLMLEHLHPNVNGYFVIADAFYQVLRDSKVLGDFTVDITSAMAREEIPVLAAEEYFGRAKVAELVSDYPFVAKPTRVILPRVQSWSDRLGKKYYQKQVGWLQMASESLKKNASAPVQQALVAKLIADALPNDARASYQAGVVLMRAQRPAEAPRYLRRAIDSDPKNGDYRAALVRAYIDQNRLEEAAKNLTAALEIAPQHRQVQALAKQMGLR